MWWLLFGVDDLVALSFVLQRPVEEVLLCLFLWPNSIGMIAAFNARCCGSSLALAALPGPLLGSCVLGSENASVHSALSFAARFVLALVSQVPDLAAHEVRVPESGVLRPMVNAKFLLVDSGLSYMFTERAAQFVPGPSAAAPALRP